MTETSTRAGPWFHGGAPGLEVGEEILPGQVTGLSTNGVICVTHHVELASSFAAHWPGGDVYEIAVEHPTVPPIEEVAARTIAEPLRCPWPPPIGAFHFTVRAAVIVRVVSRGVANPLGTPQPHRPVVRRRYAGPIPKSALAPR